MLAKSTRDPSELGSRFEDVFVVDAGFILHNNLLNLVIEGCGFFESQRYFTLSFARPYESTVERLRGEIGSEE